MLISLPAHPLLEQVLVATWACRHVLSMMKDHMPSPGRRALGCKAQTSRRRGLLAAQTDNEVESAILQ